VREGAAGSVALGDVGGAARPKKAPCCWMHWSRGNMIRPLFANPCPVANHATTRRGDHAT
jgi:hypothetical protein